MGLWIYTITAAVVGFLMYPYLGGGPPQIILPVNPEGLPKLPFGMTRKVLVIGGGVSGLSAALELAERGFEVTIKEKQTSVGGRYSTHKLNALGEEFQLSTGFHACFHNYHNFKRIRKNLGVEKYYVLWPDNHFAFRDYEWENVYSSGPWPLNLLAMIIRSPNLSLWTAIKTWRVSLGFILYNHGSLYETYDNLTYDEWADMYGVVPEFGDIWLKPGISASFDEVSSFSAAEFLLFSHFYFLSVAEAEHRDYSSVDSGTSLINPWVEKLKGLGVKFELGTAVTALGFDGSGKVTHDISDPSKLYDHVILAVDLGSAKKILSDSLEQLRERNSAVERALARIKNDLKHLDKAPPFKILKVWFDKQLERDRNHPILQTPQHSPVNLIVQLHQVEQQYRDWVAKTGGSVMEFHLYCWSHGEVEDDKVWEIISPTVREIYPEIFDSNFKILASYLKSGDSCASFKNGTAQHRPRAIFPSKCGIPNLGLAGDWLRTDYPSALTERSVSTAIESVNQVLLAEGIQQVPLTVTTSFGPGFI